MRSTMLVRGLLAALLLLAVAAGPAHAASWTGPLDVPGGFTGETADRQTAFDADGNAVAAFLDFGGGQASVWITTRPHGGSWANPTPVPDTNGASELHLAVAPDGAAAVTWTLGDTAEAVHRSAGGAFGDVHQFDVPVRTDADPQSPWITFAPADPGDPPANRTDRFFFGYAGNPGPSSYVVQLASVADDGVWSEVPVTGTAGATPTSDVQIDLDPGAGLRAVWTTGDIEADTPELTVETATFDGATWSAIETLASGLGGVYPQPALSSSDSPGAIMWFEDADGDDLTTGGHERYAVIDQGAVGSVQTVDAVNSGTPSPSGATGGPTVLRRGDDGSVWAAFTDAADIKVARLPSDATAFDPAEIASGPFGANPNTPGPWGDGWDMVVDGTQPFVSWASLSDNNIWVSRRVGGGSYDIDSLLSDPGPDEDAYGTQLALDNMGNVVATFVHRIGPGPGPAPGTKLAVWDTTAPEIGSLTVPQSGQVGSSVPFSAVATDDWSPVRVDWSFGDADSAQGTSVHHTYATPGTRTVTVRAVSAGGSSADKTAQIVVKPVPVVTHETTPDVVTPPPADQSSPPTVRNAPAGPPLLSEAQVRQTLATFPKRPIATLAGFLKRGVTFQQLFPGPGKVVWQLYLGRPSAAGASAAKAPKPLVIGTARKTVGKSGAVKARIKVSARRRAAVRKAGRRGKVFLKTTFTDASGRRFTTVKQVRIKH